MVAPAYLIPPIPDYIRNSFKGYTERDILILNTAKTIEIESRLKRVEGKVECNEKDIVNLKIKLYSFTGALVVALGIVSAVLTIVG